MKLLNNFGIKKKLISLHDYNENSVIDRIGPDLVDKISVLISDAGSPLISDPGFKLISYCISNKINISSIPGPTSIIPALQLSGFPINEFQFLGFFPKTKKQMLDFIKKINQQHNTCVFFVSSNKIKICLDELSNSMENRKIAVSKELTKLNEKVFRGTADFVKNEFIKKNENKKGEFVVVVSQKIEKKIDFFDLKGHEKEIEKLLLKFSLTDVAQIVHKLTGITKNKVYKWLLNLKKL